MGAVAKMFRFLGDTVEEVARKLVDNGYPPETAVRMADGTLPMDYASRMQRATEQGYDVLNPEYRGGGLTQIENPESLFENGFYSSQNPYVANTYSMKAGGNLMPVAVRKDGYLPVDANGADWNEIQVQNGSPLQQMLLDNGYRGAGQIDTDQILNVAIDDAGLSGVSYNNVRDIGPFTRSLGKEFLGKAWDGANNTASMNPSNVKSLLSAAFDPQYKGSNILGGSAGLGVLGEVMRQLEEKKNRGMD